jgi:predicted membrane chloride channel (bestrophin family)
MQKGSRGEPIQDSVSKPIMLGLVTALVVGIVAPLIVPHLDHPSMIYHITLHIASLTIALFLSIVSVLAYRRSAGARLLFMTLGFMALAVVEFLYLLDATALLSIFSFSTLGVELPHVILLAMLAMFGLGVLKVNK